MKAWRGVLLGFTLAAAQGAGANGFDVSSLMKRLAAAPAGEVKYVEKKHSILLAAPVDSSGTLAFRKPDVVEKNVLTPRVERYRIAGDELTVTHGGRERRVALSSQPLLAAFAASLRGVLAGDEDLLREHYRLVLEGTEAAWRLDLVPIDEGIGRFVEKIAVSGRGARIAEVEVRETNGDRSVMQVR